LYDNFIYLKCELTMNDDELEIIIDELRCSYEAEHYGTSIYRLMGNKHTPIQILEKLCWDPDSEIRECIQYNKKAQLEELKQAEEDLFFLLWEITNN